jgi:modification methylase
MKEIKHNLRLQDCVSGMTELEDNSIDLILSGPPYFDHVIYSNENENLSTKKPDEFYDGMTKLWQNSERKLKEKGIIAIWLHDVYKKEDGYFTLHPLHAKILETFSPNLKLRNIIVWDRYANRTQELPPEETFGTRFQYILIYSKGATNYEETLKKLYWQPIWKHKTYPKFLGSKTLYYPIMALGKNPFTRKILNPLFSKTKKLLVKDKYQEKEYITTCPEEVAQMLMDNFTRPYDTVCDPFLGSGTTMKVASRLNRKCIGFEINKKIKNVILEKVGPADIDITE